MPTIPTPELPAPRGKARMHTASGEVRLLQRATSGRRPDTIPIRAALSRVDAHSEGGRVVGGSGQNGSGFVGQSGNGDVYAGKDGNVYKKTDNGWQQYQNGGWNSVNSSGANSSTKSSAQAQTNSTRIKELRTRSPPPQAGSPAPSRLPMATLRLRVSEDKADKLLLVRLQVLRSRAAEHSAQCDPRCKSKTCRRGTIRRSIQPGARPESRSASQTSRLPANSKL